MALKADQAGYRFLVLFFNCMLTFGSYFCFDMPSVLQDVFTMSNNCTNGTGGDSLLLGGLGNSTGNYSCNNCTDCLGLSEDSYNLLYAIYAWTNAVVVIAAGFLIDKLGNRVGVFLFSFLCVLGSCTFAVGAMLKGTAAMLPVMLIGRLIFGSGNGSLTIVQNKITAFWFRDKELAMAFGITLAFSRLGSVLNFFFTQSFAESYTVQWTLWGGAMLCGLGFVSAMIVSFLDLNGAKQLGGDAEIKTESKKLRFTDIRYFSVSFWLVVLAIMFFYNGVFPFVADASEFIYKKYGNTYNLDRKKSSYIAGSIYDVSMVMSPFLGGLIDVFGKRGYLALMCALFSIPVFGLLAFTYVYPLICTLLFGVMYSVAAASLWPSIPLVVTQATIGTAMGLTTSIQMIGIGISNLVVGSILGNQKIVTNDVILERWKYVMIFLLGNILACVATTICLNVIDKRKGGMLNLSRKQKVEKAKMLQESAEHEEVVPEYADREYDERDPLLTKRRQVIN